MKIRLVLFGIALSAFAASLFCLFQATAIAQPYSPTYPTPYTGPMTVTTPYSISLGDTGDTFSFTVPSANIQNGELQGTSIFVNSTEMGSYSGAWPPGINRAGVAAPYQINMPTFGFSQTSGAGVADAERPCCDSSSTQSFSFTIVPQSGPFHGNTFITYPSQIPTSGPQVMPNPSSYKPPLGGSGTVTVQSVLNTPSSTFCCINAFSESGNITVTVNQTFRPWTAGDILTTQVKPPSIQLGAFQVNPGTNFGFTAQQAAAAGLGGATSQPFQNFNWVQTYTASGFNPNPVLGAIGASVTLTTAGTPLYYGPMGFDTSGRTIGSVDPLIGGNPGSGAGGISVADQFPEYWDQVTPAGGLASQLYSAHNNGLSFGDQPNLVSPGVWLSFKTSLVGVYAGNENNPVYLADAFNDPEFTLNWLWVQLQGSGIATVTTDGLIDPTQDLGTAFFLGYGDIPTDTLISEIDADLASLTATPNPAALPLFATGLGGLGLLGWRRKRKAQAVA